MRAVGDKAGKEILLSIEGLITEAENLSVAIG